MNRKISLLLVLTGLCTSQILHAASLDQRLKSCLDGNINEQEKRELIVTLADLKQTFSSYVENSAAACYTKLTGQPSEFANGVGFATTDEDIAEMRRLIKVSEAEVELKSRLEATIPNLEKRRSCVSGEYPKLCV